MSKLYVKAIKSAIFGIIVFAALIFLPAGTLNYWQGWAFLATFVFSTVIITVYLALHDPLCGLPNRNFFSERLEAVIADVKRGGTPAAVFYIDLDHFKDVNDTLGHPIGDELIRNVTLRLSRTMRWQSL